MTAIILIEKGQGASRVRGNSRIKEINLMYELMALYLFLF